MPDPAPVTIATLLMMRTSPLMVRRASSPGPPPERANEVQLLRSRERPEAKEGGRMSIEIAVIGPQRPFVLEALEREFTVHNVSQHADKIAALGPAAARVRATVTNAMAGLS